MSVRSSSRRTIVCLRRTVPNIILALVATSAIAVGQPSHDTGIYTSPPIDLNTDTAQVIPLAAPAKTVFVANPAIADIQVASPTRVLVYGKKAGATTVFVISNSGVTTSYPIQVDRPTGELIAALHHEVPSAHVTVTATPDGITLSGDVGSPADAARLQSVAKQFLGDKQHLNFDVAINSSTQVTLEVRVAEVDRNVNKALGVHWDQLFGSQALSVAVLGGVVPLLAAKPAIAATQNKVSLQWQVNANTLIDALNTEGLATILAEPTLTATSGQTAKFLAGGEFPIPIPQGNQTVTITYKQYGVSVDFTPTVLDRNRISIKVRPEVSELTSIGGLQLDGVAIPALTTRRIETTVELGSGQSFVIAGLFQNNAQNQISAVPALGNLPILGALFRSSTFQRNESELVIIVTPYIVRPVSRVSDLHLPTDGFHYSSDIGRILMNRLTAAHPQGPAPPAAATTPAPQLSGPAGFLME